jgi:hypothetical protein
MSIQVVAACADTLQALTRSKNKLSIEDMRLPWKPIYNLLSQDLFLSRREFEYTYVGSTMISEDWGLTLRPLRQSAFLVYGLYRRHIEEVFPPCRDKRNASHIRTSDQWDELGRMSEDVEPVIH